MGITGVRNDAARVVVETHPVQRRVHDLLVTRLETHQLVGCVANESFWIAAMHRRFKEIHVVHGMVPGRGGTISFGVGLRVCRTHPVGAPHGGF